MTPSSEQQFVTVSVRASVDCVDGRYYPTLTTFIAGYEHEKLRYEIACDTEHEAIGMADEIATVERERIRRNIQKELARMKSDR